MQRLNVYLSHLVWDDLMQECSKLRTPTLSGFTTFKEARFTFSQVTVSY